jgi:hypothetical protein
MSLFDSFRRGRAPAREPAPPRSEDEIALERYRYMLQTAPPDQIERAHEEAFARLTPEQRRLLLRELAAEVPPEERVQGDDPRALARMATRAEMRRPGTIERTLGGVPVGGGFGGFGGVLGGTLLGSLVGSFLGTAMAEQFFGDHQLDDRGAGLGHGGTLADDQLSSQEDGLWEQDLDAGDSGGDMI